MDACVLTKSGAVHHTVFEVLSMRSKKKLGQLVGARVRELRLQQGLTLEQLSDAAGLLPEAIGRAERGYHAPSLSTLSRLARGLGLPMSELVKLQPHDDHDRVVRAGDAGIPPEVRGIAMLLAGQDESLLRTARRILEVLVEEAEARRDP